MKLHMTGKIESFDGASMATGQKIGCPDHGDRACRPAVLPNSVGENLSL